VCGASLEFADDTMRGELKDCIDCGVELEVAGIDPIILHEAPEEEEDWGQ
jgi:alpha-aminoadipate carrier protein LysW